MNVGEDLGIECAFAGIPIFYVQETYHQLNHRATCYVGPNPQTTKDFSYLLGKKVLIGNRIVTCWRVERYAHASLHYCGEKIGVWIKYSDITEIL